MAEEELPEAEAPDEMGVVILMLGLYLIVLAFFILLNAMSETSEEKTEKVSESINEGFGFQLSGPLNMRDDVSVTVNPVFDIVSREIQSVMESFISDNKFKFSTNANQMVLAIDTKQIFSPGSIRIRPAMAYFFEDVARIVSTQRPGSRLLTEVVIKNNETDIGSAKIPVRELAGRRAALFIRALLERGVNPKYISGGVEVSDESTIEVFFEIIVTDHAKALSSPRDVIRRDSGGYKAPVPEPR